jgi:hypothetical protein
MKSIASSKNALFYIFCMCISAVAGFGVSQPAKAFDFDEAFKTIMCRALIFETGQCREKINPATVTPQPNPTTDTVPNSPVPSPSSSSDQEETDENNSSESSSSQSSETYIFQNYPFPNRN